MTRVIHTADTHIGYRQYHSPERKRDFLAAFEAVIGDAIEQDVDAVVHAGDLFHDTRPDLEDLMGTVGILRDLAAAEIPFLGVVGNHERTRDRQWLDLIADLELAVRLDETGTRLGDVTFYGLDWIPPAQRDRLEYDFAAPETDTTALVAHGLFEPFPHADWETEALLDSASVEFDALLLGDNHTPDRVELRDTWITYAGSTERTSADEREGRGYNLVTFDEDVRIARRSIEPTRSFAFVDVRLEGEEGLERIRDRILERDVEDAVVIVRLDGAGADVAPAAIEDVARNQGALVVRVFDDRELDEETVRESVQFADPDRAVAERIDELGLSAVGHMIDDIVRDASVPDAAVRNRVRSRTETLLEEAPEAFDPTQSRDGTPERSTDPAPIGDDGNEDQTSIGEFG